MCIAGPEFLQLTGITEEDLIQPALKLKSPMTSSCGSWVLYLLPWGVTAQEVK